MKKTFCDRCGVECNGQTVQRFTIFDVNRAIDVCENCYKEFFRWLQSGENCGCTVKMKDGKPIVTSKCTDGLDSIDEFIKDVVNDKNHKNCLDDNNDLYDKNDLYDGCDDCYYIDKKYFDYPCRECTRCNVDNGYVKADHFVKGDKKNEN